MIILVFSAVAGIAGTGLGGLITIIIGKRSPGVICGLLSFAAGVMTSIVCFGLIPEAIGLSNIWIMMLGLVVGVAIIMLLNRFVDVFTGGGDDNLLVHDTHEALYHGGELLKSSKAVGSKSLLRSGLIMLVAIGLHNIPEGMAIGAGGSHDTQLGALLALMIALHDIPEGMAIAAPLMGGGIRKGRVFLLTSLAGATTFIGGIIGVLIGSISETAVALSLSAAGGAMLYVVFGEIIPQSVVMMKNRWITLITLLGIILGLLVSSM